MDSKQLYQEVILDHNRKPRNYGKLEHPTHSAEGLNPLCGDHIWLHLDVADGLVRGIAFEGAVLRHLQGASASMMTAAVKGKSVVDAETLVDEFRAMATGTLDTTTVPNHLGRLSVFGGVKDLPSRVKCAILPWHTLHAAIRQQRVATTEGDHDPISGTS